MSINYKSLFQMSDPFSTKPLRLSVGQDPRFKSENFRVLVSELFLGKKTDIDLPLKLIRLSGGGATDIIWSALGPVILISERVIEIFESESLSGWDVYPVLSFGKDGNALEGYWGLAVKGRNGRQDLMRGQVLQKPPVVPGGKPCEVLKGFYFQDDLWDGKDFSTTSNGGFINVSQKVVNILKRNKISNVMFTKLTEVENAIFDYKQMGIWPKERGL